MLRRNGAQKLLGVLITIGEAVAYVVSGMYGDVRELGAGNAVLIILQVQRPSFDLHMLMAVDTSQRLGCYNMSHEPRFWSGDMS